MTSKLQNSGHHRPLDGYFNGVLTLALPILHISMALWVESCKIPATIAYWNDISMWYKHWHFQFYGFMSSNLKNSGQHRPLEWYFNGVLKLPILQIPMALYFQNSGHHSPRKWYFMGVLALLIRNIPMAFWVQCCQIPANIAHWNDISMGTKHWHCQFLTFLWP